MERRAFLTLGGSLVAGCGTRSLVPDPDSDAELRRLALRMEQRQLHTAERFRQQRARLSPEDLAQERSARVLAPFEHALVGMQAYASMSALPLEAQAHPAVQRVFMDGMERLGAGLRGISALLDRLTPQDLSELDARLLAEPGLLAGAQGFVRGELMRGLPARSEELLAQTVDRLGFRMGRGGTGALVAELRRDLKRLDRSARRGDWSALEPTDPRQRARIERATAGWAATASTEPEPARTGAAIVLVLLGLLSIGAGTVAGVGLLAVGIDSLACLCVGIPLIVLGLVVLALGILGGVACFAWAGRLFSPDDLSLGGSAQVVLDLEEPDWRATGLRAGSGIPVLLQVEGQVEVGGVTCGPNGHPTRIAGPGTPAPGLPYAAVVGRVDLGQPFVVGIRAETPLGEQGPIDVAINALASEGDRGRFAVTLD